MKDRIKKIRKAEGLTQIEFGKRIGVKGNTITNYETGLRNPTDAVVKSICREFNVNETWLRTGQGEMFIPSPSSELDVLIKKYGLSANDRVLIEKFVNLKQDERNAVLDFIQEVASGLEPEDESTDSVESYYEEAPSTPEELEAQFPPEEKPRRAAM